MASASIHLSEEELLCSICWDVFTDPITTPCGHNYCNTCIAHHWDTDVCKCRICNKPFYRRPEELCVNKVLSEMADQFRKAKQLKETSSSNQDVETVSPAVAQLEKTLSQEMEMEMELCDELGRIQRYAVDVILDPDTANFYLILSEDGKQVHSVKRKNNLPDNKERFTTWYSVLGKQGFSSGRFYYEVQVKDKMAWYLGAARESIDRTDGITHNGYWTIRLEKGNQYYAVADPDVSIPVREKLQTVGVFVDYEEGLVSFYDVEARVHLYSFTGCNFTEKIYPVFNPCGVDDDGRNSAPLIISPVNHTD